MEFGIKSKVSATVLLCSVLGFMSCDKHVPVQEGPQYTQADVEFDSALKYYLDKSYDSEITEVKPESSSFSFEVDRHTQLSVGLGYDRLLSKWAIVRKTENGGYDLVSAAHYADSAPVKSHPAPVPLRNKKGLGGIFNNTYLTDFDELDLGNCSWTTTATVVILRFPT